MGTEIADLFASVPGLKADYKVDWKEDTNNDWRIDWDATTGTPPVNTVAPVITGALTVGSVLTSTQGTWTGTGIIYAYQWKRDGVNIAGQTALTHTIVTADVGTTLSCVVTATNANGEASEADTQVVPAIAPVNTVLPVISTDGTPAVGETVTVNTGTWTGQPTPTYTYQWKKSGVEIAGATTSSYTLLAGDVGASTITCTVTATNAGGTASVTTAAISVA